MQVGPVQDLHGDALSSTSISVTWGHVLLRNLSMWHTVNYTNEWDGVSEVRFALFWITGSGFNKMADILQMTFHSHFHET